MTPEMKAIDIPPRRSECGVAFWGDADRTGIWVTVEGVTVAAWWNAQLLATPELAHLAAVSVAVLDFCQAKGLIREG